MGEWGGAEWPRWARTLHVQQSSQLLVPTCTASLHLLQRQAHRTARRAWTSPLLRPRTNGHQLRRATASVSRLLTTCPNPPAPPDSPESACPARKMHARRDATLGPGCRGASTGHRLACGRADTTEALGVLALESRLL